MVRSETPPSGGELLVDVGQGDGAGRPGQSGPSGGQTLAADLDGAVVELPLLVAEIEEVELGVCHVDNYPEGV